MICIGAAHGLAYLHSAVGTQQRLLHRDIKSSNILLDDDWNAKISDFGLSKLGPTPTNQNYTFLFTHAVGTFGYCDPLYTETGLLTKESDVYSFGVVLFEVLCGRLSLDDNQSHRSLIGLVRMSYDQNKIDDIICSKIKDEVNHDSLKVFTKLAYQCLKRDREERPLMTDVVRELEIALQCQVISYSFFGDSREGGDSEARCDEGQYGHGGDANCDGGGDEDRDAQLYEEALTSMLHQPPVVDLRSVVDMWPTLVAVVVGKPPSPIFVGFLEKGGDHGVSMSPWRGIYCSHVVMLFNTL
ncbi:hypothetical protein QVD17_35553 [Tagetes erecta]|uniref:Protein kinase domain-containing protein n=1 Tax=Tagetes erecta TaxID=13708 RepID=A0AAD8K3U0_TARER|nr:hypothetical protein QVD17_35553 [Tagetes erecta]